MLWAVNGHLLQPCFIDHKQAGSIREKKKVLAKYLLLFDPIWFSVFSVCISMTHGQCQNDGTCVPDELSPDKTPAEEKGAEALWDRSRVKDGANADRLLVHTHI